MTSEVLTKEYLIKLGVTDVSRDGMHIMKGNKEVHQRFCKGLGGYMVAGFYDPAVYRESLQTKKNNVSHLGTVNIYVHRIVWAWYHGQTTKGLVIDHKNNNRIDNRLENLQELTNGDNVWKDRPHDIYLSKCRLSKPLSFYEDKLKKYQDERDLAKKNNDHKAYMRASRNISVTKAKIRYYLANKPKQD